MSEPDPDPYRGCFRGSDPDFSCRLNVNHRHTSIWMMGTHIPIHCTVEEWQKRVLEKQYIIFH